MSEAVEKPTIADLREDGVDEIVAPYLKQIRETPELLSLLYDIDLLPEQIVYRVNAVRMVAVCLVFQKRYQQGVEDAAKACRYMAKNQNFSISEREPGSYGDGFEAACALCDEAIRRLNTEEG